MLSVTFLTDYGYEDEFAGACRAAIARLEPGVRVIDLTHGIPAGDVRRGALALEAAAPAAGAAVHLAVVDPGVGTRRRGLALRTRGQSFLVGPDNGLLGPAAERLGGVAEAADISESALRLEPVAPTFHGRDLFAPVAAHLAAGRPLAVAGEPIDPGGLVALELPRPRCEGAELIAHILYADGFGNLILDARPQDLAAAIGGRPRRGVRVEASDRTWEAVCGTTFAEGEGGLVLLRDSSERLALALDRGSAATELGVARDDELRIAASS